ncbi:MAG: YqhA family protein [bacterium]
MRLAEIIEVVFEKALWQSRFVVLSAVLACLAVSIGMFYMSTVDAVETVSKLFNYANYSYDERAIVHKKIVGHVVSIIDGYLIATVLLIFSLGLYELFISKIDEAAHSETASKVLVINNLDDLKARLAKVVLMILIVKFFEQALDIKFQDPMDMLAFAGGIALIGLSLFLSHAADKKPH